MAVLCRRALKLLVVPSSATGAALQLQSDVVEATIRVVDAAGVPVAWTLAQEANPSVVFHFTAGESYTAADLKPSDPINLVIVSAVATHRIEALIWTRS